MIPRRFLGIRWWIALVVAAGIAPAAAAEEVTIAPSKDNTLFEDATGSLSDGAGPTFFAGNNGQGLIRRAVLAFDVTAAVPAGARIESATLTLYLSNAPNTTLRTLTLHRVLRDWGEGTSYTTGGSGAPATDGDATWLHTQWPDAFWAAPGGDFQATASASQDVIGVAFYSWTDTAMANDVQSWLDDPAGNHGWLLRGDEVTLNTARRFDSRESDVATQRPALVIHYTGTVGVGDRGAPPGIAMQPCRPNPTSRGTRVAFSIAARSLVHIDVMDAAGRHVVALMDGPLEAGAHEIAWDGRDSRGDAVGAGVYLCRLRIDGKFVATRAVVMLR